MPPSRRDGRAVMLAPPPAASASAWTAFASAA